MTMQWESLDDLLSEKLPWIDTTRTIRVPNTPEGSHRGLDYCVPWRDFTYKNMREHLDHYFETEDSFRHDKVYSSDHYPCDARHIRGYVLKWCSPSVAAAMDTICKETLQSPNPTFARFEKLDLACGWEFSSPEGTPLHPDLAGQIAEVHKWDDKKMFFPGRSLYTSVKFSESEKRIKTDDGDFGMAKSCSFQKEADHKFAKLAEVCTIAYHLNGRYAFIVTPKQVVFIRISKGDAWGPRMSSNPELDIPEVSVVPWEGREDGMTVRHAFVWIHYLAAMECNIRDTYESLGPDLRD